MKNYTSLDGIFTLQLIVYEVALSFEQQKKYLHTRRRLYNY